MVTSHISKKVSPRTFLVFMENHPFENFSPHTFLVFMENHGFELQGFPGNPRASYNIKQPKVRRSPATYRLPPPHPTGVVPYPYRMVNELAHKVRCAHCVETNSQIANSLNSKQQHHALDGFCIRALVSEQSTEVAICSTS